VVNARVASASAGAAITSANGREPPSSTNRRRVAAWRRIASAISTRRGEAARAASNRITSSAKLSRKRFGSGVRRAASRSAGKACAAC
jgi:hypothetical protein